MAQNRSVVPPYAKKAKGRGEDSPLSLIAAFMREQKWPFELRENDLHCTVAGQLENYAACFRWYPEMALVAVACSFEYKPPKKLFDTVGKLCLLINECLALGHFEHRPEYHAMIHRNGFFFLNDEISNAQIQVLLQNGVTACDGYVTAYKFLLDGTSPETALHQAGLLNDIQGRA